MLTVTAGFRSAPLLALPVLLLLIPPPAHAQAATQERTAFGVSAGRLFRFPDRPWTLSARVTQLRNDGSGADIRLGVWPQTLGHGSRVFMGDVGIASSHASGDGWFVTRVGASFLGSPQGGAAFGLQGGVALITSADAVMGMRLDAGIRFYIESGSHFLLNIELGFAALGRNGRS